MTDGTKINLSKEWYEKHIRDEGDHDISAGNPNFLEDNMIDVELDLEQELIDFLELKAESLGISLNQLVNNILEEHIKNIK